MTEAQKIAKLKRLRQGSRHILRYSGNKITGIEETGILVWELFGPDMADFLTWDKVDWTKFTAYEYVGNPFV